MKQTVFEGDDDMRLDSEQLKMLDNPRRMLGSSNVKIDDIDFPHTDLTMLAGKRWPNGEVFYEISSNNFRTQTQAQIKKYVSTLHDNLSPCIKFIERNHGDRIVVDFSQTQSNSKVGYHGGKQYIYLTMDGVNQGTVHHEFLHSLGMIHEHQRNDRDKYVKNKSSMLKSNPINYQKFNRKISFNYGQEYDFNSVMHYGKTGRLADGTKTTVIKTIDPKMLLDSE